MLGDGPSTNLWKSTMSKIKGMAYKSLARGDPFVNDYEILGWLGSGGFGSVAHVKNKLEDKEYAIKIIPILAEDSKQIKENKYIQEARTLAQVSTGHINVVRFYHSWVEPLTPELKKQITFQDDCEDGDFDSAYTSQYPFSIYDNSLANSKSKSNSSFVSNGGGDDESTGDSFNVSDMSFGTPRLTFDDCEMMSFSPKVDENLSQSSAGSVGASDITTAAPKISTISPLNEFETTFILFLQMELCTSQTLREWIDERTAQRQSKLHVFDIQERLRIFYQVLTAVEHIHQQGIIHRDLKPGNVFLMKDNLVKVGDFGLSALPRLASTAGQGGSLSSLLSPTRASGLEDLTSGVGTFLYAAPEQLNEGENYGFSADVFALGIVLFELLQPFETGMERASVLQHVRNGQIPQSFSEKYPEISNIVRSCVSKPENRPRVSQLLMKEVFQEHQSDKEQILRRQFAMQLQKQDGVIAAQKRTISEKDEIIKDLGWKMMEMEKQINSLTRQLSNV